MIDRTRQVCHRESEETLRNNVYDRRRKNKRNTKPTGTELATAHRSQICMEKGAVKRK